MKGAALAALTAPLARSASAAPSAGGGVAYSRTLPVKHEVDVFVAGGGPAGVAAALAADRSLSVHDVPVKELQAKLRAYGAYLPQA